MSGCLFLSLAILSSPRPMKRSQPALADQATQQGFIENRMGQADYCQK
jgi:hypothetical protein